MLNNKRKLSLSTYDNTKNNKKDTNEIDKINYSLAGRKIKKINTNIDYKSSSNSSAELSANYCVNKSDNTLKSLKKNIQSLNSKGTSKSNLYIDVKCHYCENYIQHNKSIVCKLSENHVFCLNCVNTFYNKYNRKNNYNYIKNNYKASGSCNCSSCKNKYDMIFKKSNISNIKFLFKKSFVFRSVSYYKINNIQLIEERIYDPKTHYLIFSPFRFTINAFKKYKYEIKYCSKNKKIYYDISDDGLNEFSPLKLGSLEQYNSLLPGICEFCKSNYFSLDRVIPIINIRDMFEYIKYMFLKDPVYPEDFENNNKYFCKFIVPNYEEIIKEYVLDNPLFICKACFENKLNAKEGLIALFNLFKRKLYCSTNQKYLLNKVFDYLYSYDNVYITFGCTNKKNLPSEFNTKTDLYNKKYYNKDKTGIDSIKTSRSTVKNYVDNTYISQYCKIELIISLSLNFSILSKTSILRDAKDPNSNNSNNNADSNSKPVLNNINNDDILNIVQNKSQNNFINSSSTSLKDKKNSNDDICIKNSKEEMSNFIENTKNVDSQKLKDFQNNLNNIISNLYKKANYMSTDFTYNDRKNWIDNINNICNVLYKDSHIFKELINKLPEYTTNVVEQIKSLLESIHSNLIRIERNDKDLYCFDRLIIFKDIMATIKKVNNVFEFMINKLKDKSST